MLRPRNSAAVADATYVHWAAAGDGSASAAVSSGAMWLNRDRGTVERLGATASRRKVGGATRDRGAFRYTPAHDHDRRYPVGARTNSPARATHTARGIPAAGRDGG